MYEFSSPRKNSSCQSKNIARIIYGTIKYNLVRLLSNLWMITMGWSYRIVRQDGTKRVHETNLFQVKKLKEKIGSRKKICTVVQKEIGTQTETKVQRTIQTQTVYNIQEPNRNVSFQTSRQDITWIAQCTYNNTQLFTIFGGHMSWLYSFSKA